MHSCIISVYFGKALVNRVAKSIEDILTVQQNKYTKYVGNRKI